MHLIENLFEIVGGFFDRMSVHSFIGCDHNARIRRQPLHLFLHIASLICAPVVTSANNKCIQHLTISSDHPEFWDQKYSFFLKIGTN